MPQDALREPPTMSISDDDALARWRAAVRRTFWSRDLPIVTFALPGISHAQNRSLTARALELRHACGCASSGFFMSMTVVGLALTYFFSASVARLPSLAQALTAVGAILLAGAVGKLLGIGWARWRLAELAEIAERLGAAHRIETTHSR